MAQRVEVTLIDDIDQSKAAETVTFALDGISYEIDLSDKHAEAARRLRTWTGHARRSGSARAVARVVGGLGLGKRTDLGAVREWARPTATRVGPGPDLAEIQAAYDKATTRTVPWRVAPTNRRGFVPTV